MGIKMNTYEGGQITAGNDAILHDRAIANTGILHGCNITFMGANQIHIEKGYLLIKGRYCTVTEDTIQVAMSNSETELPGRLYVRADLADAQEPVKILSVAADPLPKLTQDENINYDNGVWEMELATYTAGMTAIKDLTVTCEEVPEGASKKETAALLGKIDELTENSLRQIWKKLETSKRSISIPTDLDYSELVIYISGGGIVGEIHVVKEYLSNVGKTFRCGSGFITGVAENALIIANVSLSTITGTIYVKDSVISSETTIFYR